MTFEEVKKLDDTYIMHTFKRKPVCFVEGEGVTVKDEEGKEYLDLLSGIGVDSLGHCHPRVAEAIAEQAPEAHPREQLLLYREAWRSGQAHFGDG